MTSDSDALDDQLAGLRRRAMVGAAPAVDDGVDPATKVVRAAAAADRSDTTFIVRVALAVVAVEVVAFGVYDLLGLGGGDTHESRHLGSFNLAYAAALLSVVHRPARARVVLPVASVLGASLLLTAIVDVANGTVPLIGEATHLAELISIPLIWWLAVGRHRRAVP